jgi:hypothetical protein
MTGWGKDAELTDGHELIRLADGAESLLSKYDDVLRGVHESIPRSELEAHV